VPPNTLPSSPIRASGEARDELLTAFGNWLLVDEKDPVIRGHIERAIEVIKEELFDLDQVKGGLARQVIINCGVKGGVAIGIAQRVSQFKHVYKAQIDIQAAQDLMRLGGRDNMDGDDEDDFFDEF
jgi:hypothetical protein